MSAIAKCLVNIYVVSRALATGWLLLTNGGILQMEEVMYSQAVFEMHAIHSQTDVGL